MSLGCPGTTDGPWPKLLVRVLCREYIVIMSSRVLIIGLPYQLLGCM